MLSKTEIDQKFSALKEHGEEVASEFKAFVTKLDGMLPDTVAKLKLVSALETASSWAHHALAEAETKALAATHQRLSSGETTDPAASTTVKVTTPDAIPPIPTAPVQEQDTPPAS